MYTDCERITIKYIESQIFQKLQKLSMLIDFVTLRMYCIISIKQKLIQINCNLQDYIDYFHAVPSAGDLLKTS